MTVIKNIMLVLGLALIVFTLWIGSLVYTQDPTIFSSVASSEQPQLALVGDLTHVSDECASAYRAAHARFVQSEGEDRVSIDKVCDEKRVVEKPTEVKEVTGGETLNEESLNISSFDSRPHRPRALRL